MPNRVVKILILTWGLLLTGLPGLLIKSQYLPPGIIQAIQLHSLLDQRRETIVGQSSRVDHLRKEEFALLYRPDFQEHEIRRVLGYAAKDEVIFEFIE